MWTFLQICALWLTTISDPALDGDLFTASSNPKVELPWIEQVAVAELGIRLAAEQPPYHHRRLKTLAVSVL